MNADRERFWMMSISRRLFEIVEPDDVEPALYRMRSVTPTRKSSLLDQLEASVSKDSPPVVI